ncbi:DUF3331 domain-containing protein [Paraburkholderia sp. GAS348]|jgi:hypothetical protein|uniref:DUF3331 domain-containing protein n=1 Tax=Paraburkholderia sp. GAS348 TaxID=3035132 RepID=UPI003D1C6747
MEQLNPWSQVVSLLSRLSSDDFIAGGGSWRAGSRRGVRAVQQTWKPSTPQKTMSDATYSSKITSIELQNNASVLISWCDPTMCHYVDQVWSRAAARNCGYCALTGQRIYRGDAVFKPSSRGRLRPVNCDEMILAAALAQAD